MRSLRALPPSRRRAVAAGCLACVAFGTPVPGAADELPSAPIDPPGTGGFIQREFDRFRAHARFDRAFRLLATRRLAEAAREFEDGLALDPGHVAARLGYAQLLAGRGAYDASLKQLDALPRRDAAALPALRLRAQMHAAAGRVRAAIADQEAVARHPAATAAERRFALETAADLSLGAGQFEQALDALDRLAVDRSDPQTLVRRALVYERMQRYGDAEAAYRAAASRTDDPERRATWTEAARVCAAMAEDRHTRAVVAALNLEEAHLAKRREARPPGALVARTRDVLMMGGARPAADPGADAGPTTPTPVPSPEDPLSAHRLQLAKAIARGGAADGEAGRSTGQAPSATLPPPAERLAALRQRAAHQAERGDHAEARRTLERLVELDPADAASHAALARTLLELNENEAAVQAAQRALERRENAAAYRLLAYAQAKSGDWAGAAGTGERLLARPGLRAPERIEVLGQVAYAMSRQQRFAESAEILERAIAEPGGRTLALYERLVYARSQAGDLAGVADAQRRALDATDATEDDRLAMRRRLAATQQALGRTDDAADTYRALLASRPDDADLQLALGTLLRHQGRWQEAEPHLVEALDRRPEAIAALELARGLKANHRAAEAIDVLRRAVDAPAEPALRKQMLDELGYLHEANADLVRAAASWAESIQVEPDPRIAMALASVQLRAGDRAAARATLEALAAVDLPPAARAARLDAVWEVETADGRHAEAREAAGQSLALEPTARRRFLAGQSERQLGHLPEAIALFEQAVAQDAQTEYLDALAYTYRTAGSYRDAARTLETLLQRDPERIGLYADLAYTYMRMGENDRARDWFERAIDLRRERTARVQLAQAPGAPLPAMDPPREDEDLRAMRDEVRSSRRPGA